MQLTFLNMRGRGRASLRETHCRRSHEIEEVVNPRNGVLPRAPSVAISHINLRDVLTRTCWKHIPATSGLGKTLAI